LRKISIVKLIFLFPESNFPGLLSLSNHQKYFFLQNFRYKYSQITYKSCNPLPIPPPEVRREKIGRITIAKNNENIFFGVEISAKRQGGRI
jgi:hypothetical protein